VQNPRAILVDDLSSRSARVLPIRLDSRAHCASTRSGAPVHKFNSPYYRYQKFFLF
jgi:hypothetical protein